MPSKPEKPTFKNAVLAHCHQCMSYYQDGKDDCENYTCPLYPFMPYGTKLEDADLTWLEYNPKKKGKVTWEESSRDMTDEQRQAIRDRFTKKGKGKGKKKKSTKKKTTKKEEYDW